MRNVLILILLAISPLAYSSPAEEPPEHNIPILDSVQQFFGANANFAANRLDSFFATDRADDEFGRSRLRIRSLYTVRERAAGNQTNQYRINLKLPHLEDKFHYDFFEHKKDKKKDKSASAAPREELKDTDILGKLRRGWIFNSDIGVSAAVPPVLTTRARVRNNFQTGKFIHRFVEQLIFVTNQQGLYNEVRLDSDRAYDENRLFRFVNFMRWKIQDKTYITQHGPTFLHRVDDDDAFNYSFIGNFQHNEGVSFFNNYNLSVDYRRNLYRQWFYLDVIPGIDFPKQWHFRRTPYIVVQIELLFGT